MGSLTGMTTKRVKAIVRNMVNGEVIEKFIVRVNPAFWLQNSSCTGVRTNNGITKDDVIQHVKEFGDLAYHVHHMERTSVAAIVINKSLNNNDIENTLLLKCKI
jgi:hypothetical protein